MTSKPDALQPAPTGAPIGLPFIGPTRAEHIAPDPITGTPAPNRVNSGPVPIGPVTSLPAGFSVARGEGSLIGKAGGLDVTYSSLSVDRYTALYWGPRTSASVAHALSGPLNSGRVMAFDAPSTDFANGIGFWTGSSPNTYAATDVATRFTLRTNRTPSGAAIPLLAANSLNIAGTDVVIGVPGDFKTNLLFETDWGSVFQPSNTFFDNWPQKSAALSGTVLSAVNGAFWYTAPDTAVTFGPLPAPVCLNSTVELSVMVTNNGPGQATLVVVSDVLPAGLQFQSFASDACPGGGCYSQVTGDWNVGTLPEGQTRTLILRVKPVSTALQVNAASRTQYQIDPVAGNDFWTQSITAKRCAWVPSLRR